jgi:hypothetical protein
MGLLLAVSKIYLPQFIQKRKLELLFDAAADAFQVATPSTRGLSYNNCLVLFARFTQEQTLRSIKQGSQIKVQSRLFQNACRIGRELKTDFHINTAEDVMRMGTLVYKLLRIEFHGEPQGNIVIKRCFFSSYYSSDVCRLISSLDEGLLSGLAGGGKLTFSKRITEGNECCRAYLEASGRPK